MKLFSIWKNGKIVKSRIPGLYVGIATTKVFGRLSHRSGANKKNFVFFHFWKDAQKAGYRECKGCRPRQCLEKETELRAKLKNSPSR